MGCIYILQNKINGKAYVGQTVRKLDKRIAAHVSHKSPIGLALLKYGKENFNITEIEVSEEEMDAEEIRLIKLHDCISPRGYNLDSGGHKHKHACAETRGKQSAAKLGDKNPWFGKTRPESACIKTSLALKGRKRNRPAWNKGKRLTTTPCRMTLYNWKRKQEAT